MEGLDISTYIDVLKGQIKDLSESLTLAISQRTASNREVERLRDEIYEKDQKIQSLSKELFDLYEMMKTR